MQTPAFNSAEALHRCKTIATDLVRVMGLDNGVTFHPFTAQRIRLQNAVYSLMEEGLAFSEDDIVQIVSGEESEVQTAYGHFQGFLTLKAILVSIFDGE